MSRKKIERKIFLEELPKKKDISFNNKTRGINWESDKSKKEWYYYDREKGMVKNLGNNKYQAYNKTSIAGVYDYGFDEGSIWTLKTYEDGQQYLVKEINGDDENDVVRTKKASSNEQKDTVSNTINNSGKYKVLLEKLDKKIIATLKEGKCVVTDNLVSEIREKLIMNGFNNASKNIVLSIAKSETTEKGGNR